MFRLEKSPRNPFFNIITHSVIKAGYYFLGTKDVSLDTFFIGMNTNDECNIYYLKKDLQISDIDHLPEPRSIAFSYDIRKINPGENRIMTEVRIIESFPDTCSFLMSNGLVAYPNEIFVSVLHFLPTLNNRPNEYAMLLLSYKKILTERKFYLEVFKNLKKRTPYYSANFGISPNSDEMPDTIKILADKKKK